MAEGVAGRLRSAGVRAGTVAVKIRDSGFQTITRQRTLAEPTDMTEPIYATALELARPEIRGMRVRLLGVTASNLGEREQLSLFESGDPRQRRGGRGGRFAAAAVRRGDGHAGAAARARGCRRRSSAIRGTRWTGGLGASRSTLTRRPRAADAGRDSQGDTDVDEIPPDDG